VKTVTIKLELEQVRWLEQQAEQRRRNRSEIVRELIDQRRNKTDGRSLLARAQDLSGVWPGPKDLSTRSLKGYGQD
jgi:Arc/MetJ-type ribon-helix-helix transcriptional regulator